MTINADALIRRERFLEQIHADKALQRLLALPEARTAATAVAKAAGFAVGETDLLAAHQTPAPGSDVETPEGGEEEIDFDGDGLPDAVKRNGRWVLTSQDY